MAKRIVICCDGTWNTLKQPATTNVVKVAEAVEQRDDQLVFYHAGVGTKTFERVLGGAFGFGLSRNVRDAYRFVVEHYEPGDELFVFGYSRGAYTARSTVGFIRNCGVLRRTEIDRIDEAYGIYRDRGASTHPNETAATEFREKYACEQRTPIRFLGVWDTVGALGIPLAGVPIVSWINRAWQFHDTKLSGSVRAAHHALAIDEKRGPFRPSIWTPDHVVDQIREQVWFAGCHGDVGGGNPEPTLAHITLHWMVERARAAGLVFRPDAFAPLAPDAETAPINQSRNGFWKLLQTFERELGVTDGQHERASVKAVERTKTVPDYKPENLLEYLATDPPLS